MIAFFLRQNPNTIFLAADIFVSSVGLLSVLILFLLLLGRPSS